MSNLFERGHNFLMKKLHNGGKSTIEFIHGTTRTTLKAQLVKTVYENTDKFGAILKTECRDFIVRVEDLPTLPVNGDKIRFNGDDYEVKPINGQDCFMYCNAFKTNIRIHTKDD